MKKAAFRWTATFVVIFLNFLFWLIPSNLAYNVAQQRDILLGRYTVDKFTILIILALISAFVIRGIWSKKKAHSKKDIFKFIAVVVSVILSIVFVDIVLRISRGQLYVSKKTYYHRPPNMVMKGVFRDEPPTAFTYPFAPDGFADNNYTMTIDSRGFRNKTDLAEYDIITIGDSFVEGSGLSDEQCWPVLIGKMTGKTVYNLGMPGVSPVTMLETLKKFAIDLSPTTIVCMLYEGNDFRASNFNPRRKNRLTLKYFYDSSPLRLSTKKLLIDVFGPINCNRRKDPAVQKSLTPTHSLYPVSLMPLPVPRDNPKYYTFKIKALAAHYIQKQDFLNSTGCKQTFEVMRQMKKLCDDHNIRLIVVYAPDKPNVLLPIEAESLSPQLLHAFMSLRVKNLPQPDELKKLILERLPVIESATHQFCRSESIEFISLTEPLRDRILKARQCYFTYDQHWTPVGHEVAASLVAAYLESQ
ncbi:hypothetical protein ES703_36158 [subsurface metagenome]